MSNASYTQAYQLADFHPSQSLTGLPSFLCPADCDEQSGEESALLRQISPYHEPKPISGRVPAMRRLDQLRAIPVNGSDWAISDSIDDNSNCRMMAITFSMAVRNDRPYGFTPTNDPKQALNAGETDDDYLYGDIGQYALMGLTEKSFLEKQHETSVQGNRRQVLRHVYAIECINCLTHIVVYYES